MIQDFAANNKIDNFTCVIIHVPSSCSVLLQGHSSQTNLFSLSQRNFVTDELTQSFTKDLRHRRIY